ncbi:FtsK/SpoIIIE domain-containing protein [Cytobacillus praedii]|uniref:FtsK/SpoIIIE domain-containing protein n=1 Tax=Cytobacillus praedii TaxID=1742358 RepID=UPI002E1BF413|nr:FtsK/SpoIIIE domain-containing protein [Cytobacillus praedii]MED3571981.1 FtsK/SpoIIIE domain-containing protein [Cytobacillus praedii]
MLFEILSSAVVSGLLLSTYRYQHGGGGNDHQKIVVIARNCGLTTKDKKEIRIHRKTRKPGYTEYVYQMPPGLSSIQFKDKVNHFQDGLNIKKSVIDVSIDDLLKINWKEKMIPQIKKLITQKKKLRKEVEIDFDGMLVFRVYQEPLTSNLDYSADLLKKINGWEVPVGVDRSGQLIKHDFEEIPHLVVGGGTRYGKSNFLNSLIVTLLKKQPDHVRFTLIDLKGGVEFSDYEHLKQVNGQIAYEPEEARDILEAAYNEMRAMQERLKKLGKKKVQDAGIKERHFIIIDEVGELNPAEAVNKDERTIKEECQTYMSKIARIGAGLGFRQLLATQYPTGDVIPRQCKQNSDAKLCFRVRNATASTVVLDEAGAEQLPRIKGRAIYQTDKRNIIQAPYIKEEDIRETIQPFINIRPRKEPEHAESHTEGTAPDRNLLVIKETRLS